MVIGITYVQDILFVVLLFLPGAPLFPALLHGMGYVFVGMLLALVTVLFTTTGLMLLLSGLAGMFLALVVFVGMFLALVTVLISATGLMFLLSGFAGMILALAFVSTAATLAFGYRFVLPTALRWGAAEATPSFVIVLSVVLAVLVGVGLHGVGYVGNLDSYYERWWAAHQPPSCCLPGYRGPPGDELMDAYLFLILVLATVRAVGDRLTTPTSSSAAWHGLCPWRWVSLRRACGYYSARSSPSSSRASCIGRR